MDETEPLSNLCGLLLLFSADYTRAPHVALFDAVTCLPRGVVLTSVMDLKLKCCKPMFQGTSHALGNTSQLERANLQCLSCVVGVVTTTLPRGQGPYSKINHCPNFIVKKS
ncbi:hypothetical protein EVAR_3020_1 [Eumeta japonica]|uniref:Uncharacterized protein n=1 Tax=Eumeta variegata TaxID=151549 RepID=A0A4C1SUA5_EUMVA|nr:hypothetical protein EVAR_3020_1 [Eumeta japonica]